MKFCLSILASLLVATTAFAAPSDIVSGSTNSNLFFSKNSDDKYEASLYLATEYDHAFENGLQVGGLLEGAFTDDDNAFTFLVGPGYNMNAQDLGNSFYGTVKAGFTRVSINGDKNTEFTARAEFGKRFKLSESVSYAPGVAVTHVFADETDPTFQVNIFKFSFLF
nr:hypothetical protein BHI3_16580 [Bacteriovorax sp. HI3]